MSETETSDDDERTLRELNEQRERHERQGWGTGHVEEQLADKQSQQELLARRTQLSEAVRQDDLPTPTREAYESEIGEIDDLLAAPIEEDLEAKRDELDQLRGSLETMERRDGWEGAQANAEEQIAQLESEAADLERKLNSEPAETDTKAELNAEPEDGGLDVHFSDAVASHKEDLATHRAKVDEVREQIEAEREKTAELRAELEAS